MKLISGFEKFTARKPRTYQMKCRICNREMKNATPDGIGPICRRKMNAISSDAASWQVEILERMKLSKILRVFNQSESWKVTIYNFKQFAICACKQVGCPHIGIAKRFLAGNENYEQI